MTTGTFMFLQKKMENSNIKLKPNITKITEYNYDDAVKLPLFSYSDPILDIKLNNRRKIWNKR